MPGGYPCDEATARQQLDDLSITAARAGELLREAGPWPQSEQDLNGLERTALREAARKFHILAAIKLREIHGESSEPVDGEIVVEPAEGTLHSPQGTHGLKGWQLKRFGTDILVVTSELSYPLEAATSLAKHLAEGESTRAWVRRPDEAVDRLF